MQRRIRAMGKGHLRVISGIAKGRRLHMVPGGGTRPIQDRVKEALFNILGLEIEGATFLDLFAGTGSVGIEALSRSARRAVFVDNHAAAIRTIRANLALTNLEASATVCHTDAFTFLRGPLIETFDFVYVAPPQYAGLWERAVLALDDRLRWLNPDAWVIVQIHPNEYAELSLVKLTSFDQRRYGNTLLVFYEYPGD